MYIKPTVSGYLSDGTQVARRQLFLILVQPEGGTGKEPIRALVRKVALEQCGHFMMGKARAFGYSIRICGSYGNNGLPRDVPQKVYDKAYPIPDDLYDAWRTGGGWNSCGSEATMFRDWALKNLPNLGPYQTNA